MNKERYAENFDDGIADGWVKVDKAGDNSSIIMMVAIAIAAATSVTALVITKKRFF